MTSVEVKSDPPDMAGSHRHWSIAARTLPIDLDPDNEVNDGGEVRRGERRDDGLASG